MAHSNSTQRFGQLIKFLMLVGMSSAFLTQLEAQEADYVFITDPGACAFIPSDINDSGEVAGTYHAVTTDGCSGYRAFYWTEVGGLVDIAPDCDISQARKINSSGDVMGFCTTSGLNNAFIWSEGSGVRFLNINDGTVCAADESALPVDINDTGMVIGMCHRNGFQWHAFVWTELGGGVDPGLFGGDSVRAIDINNDGDVLVFVVLPAGNSTAVVWNQGSSPSVFLDTPNSRLRVRAINGNGYVVGSYESVSGGHHAAIWNPAGLITDLHPLGDEYRSVASAINDAGQVVGSRSTGFGDADNHQAFIWTAENGLVDVGNAGVSCVSGGGNQPIWIGPSNDHGHFIGTRRRLAYTFCEETYRTPYNWTESTGMMDLWQEAFSGTSAVALNNVGQIVGYVNYDAILWNLPIVPPTPIEEIQVIKDLVNALVGAGRLNAGEATSLNSKLDASAGKLTGGNTKPGCNILEAFNREVEAKIRSGELTQEEGDSLIDAAHNVTACL